MDKDLNEIKEKVLPLLKRAGVLKSSIFGSAARGEDRPDSDLDILVELPEGASLFDLFDLQEKLQNVLGRRVDLGTYRSVKPLLRDEIFSGQVRIL